MVGHVDVEWACAGAQGSLLGGITPLTAKSHLFGDVQRVDAELGPGKAALTIV